MAAEPPAHSNGKREEFRRSVTLRSRQGPRAGIALGSLDSGEPLAHEPHARLGRRHSAACQCRVAPSRARRSHGMTANRARCCGEFGTATPCRGPLLGPWPQRAECGAALLATNLSAARAAVGWCRVADPAREPRKTQESPPPPPRRRTGRRRGPPGPRTWTRFGRGSRCGGTGAGPTARRYSRDRPRWLPATPRRPLYRAVCSAPAHAMPSGLPERQLASPTN